MPPRLAREQKSQHTLATKIAGAAGSKLSFSYPPPKNVLRSSGLASHHTGSLVNRGGRLVTSAQISHREGLSRRS